MPQRLAGALLDILKIKNTLSFQHFTQEMLADLAGITRESANVVLRALRREGVLSWRQSHSPELLDEDRLKQIYT